MFYAIANLSSQKTFPVEPWNYKVDVPVNAATSKAAFTKWCQKPSTQNCHFSVAEGMDPMRRVDKENPAIYLHGLIADYDAPVTNEMLAALREDSPVEFAPQWACRTFSGHARLVWKFEEPLSLPNPEAAKLFLRVVKRKLKLTSFLPGLDDDAFFDPHRYYEKGREWVDICNDNIPANFTHQWMYEAGKKIKWETYGVEIPLELVAAKIKEIYPDRWKGPFEEGTRGVRFWDPEAENASAAVVRTTGMHCFTGPEPFMLWEQLLGREFVAEFEASRIGQIISDSHFDGQYYWREDGEKWIHMIKEDFKLRMRVRYDLSSATKRKDNSSEVDRALSAVQEQKRVHAALPFIHKPPGILHMDGMRYLNTSTVRCMTPASDGGTEWGDGFPWLAEFFDGLFSGDEQLPFFLSWWKHFYQNGYEQTPRTGHAIFIAGDPNVGKTLLSTAIIAPTVGGFMDASEYLLGEGKFTSHVVSAPIMAVDDTSPATDARRHARYSATIKKITANRRQLYEAKYHAASLVEWLGRIFVTCNLDFESMKLFPDLEISMLDKIMLFRCTTRTTPFPANAKLEWILAQELPYICRFLLNYEIPEQCQGDVRFGCKAYHEPLLHRTALQTGPSFSFLELLREFLLCHPDRKGKEHWVGTSTKLVAEMRSDVAIGTLAANYQPSQVASMLGQLKSRGFAIERVRTSSHRKWKIPFTGWEEKEME